MIIFCTDDIRAFICAPLETFVLINTWNISIINCEEPDHAIGYSHKVINLCRFTMTVRSLFNVTQPFGFIAIAYERLRTVVKRNGNLNLSVIHHKQQEFGRLKKIMIWICVSILLGIIAGAYQAIAYSPSNTCYGQSNAASRAAMIIRLFCIISAALISSFIYGKIYSIVRKYQNNSVAPIVTDANNINFARNQTKSAHDMHRKEFRLAKQSFVIFLSFFLCRVPSVIMILMTMILTHQLSATNQYYFEEFTNLSVQLTFLATITDPLAYIWSQPRLKQKFFRLPIVRACFTNRCQK